MPASDDHLTAELVAATLLYCAGAIVFTWPLARVLTHAAVGLTNLLTADLYAYLWILTWVSHALGTHPTQLFSGNVLYPAPNVIAQSEHMLGDQPIFGPIWALTGNAVLGYNLVVLSSFVLCGLAMHVTVRRWTGSVLAAFAAGIAFTYGPWRLDMGRAHLLQVYWFPLILLWLDEAALTGSRRAALFGAAALAMQVLCSYYLGYFAMVMIGVYVFAMALGHGVRRIAWGPVALLVLVPVIVIAPLTTAYLRNAAAGQIENLWANANFIGTWQKYVAPRFILRLVALSYVGWRVAIVGALGLLQLARWQEDRRQAVRVLGLVLCTVVATVLALGPVPLLGGWFPVYQWLSAVVVGFSRVRSPVRFGCIASVAVSALAGLAVAAIAQRMRTGTRPLLWRATLGFVMALLVSGLRPGIALTTTEVPPEAPPVYRWLAAHGDHGTLLELPIGPELGFFQGVKAAEAMYFSTVHWLPLLNGYTSYLPRSYPFVEGIASQLPESDALRLLVRCTGLRWIIVHDTPPDREAAWSSVPGLELRSRFPGLNGHVDRLFEVTSRMPGDCPGGIDPGDATVEGHRIVDRPDLTGTLVADGVPDSATPFGESLVTLTLHNASDTVWAAATPDVRRVALAVHWLDADGHDAVPPGTIILPRDVSPGTAAFRVWVRRPRPGRYRLRLALHGATPTSDAAISWEHPVLISADAVS